VEHMLDCVNRNPDLTLRSDCLSLNLAFSSAYPKSWSFVYVLERKSSDVGLRIRSDLV
jgi:hypothetical protein